MRHHIIALGSVITSLTLLMSGCGLGSDQQEAPPASTLENRTDADEEIAEVDEALAPQYTCDSGPSQGQLCSSYHDCTSYCYGGPSTNQACSTGADCQRMCSDGPSVGAACSVASDCGKYCIGNLSTLRHPCSTNADCGAPGSGGTCTLPSCAGVGCRAPGCNNPNR